ncbi:hypothetical protein DV738_g2745, partial [Chaetothyriales sp. CBS 135597]
MAAAINAVDNTRVDTTTVPEKLHDPSIPLEEYIHYANITRAEEDRLYGPGSNYIDAASGLTLLYKKHVLHQEVAEGAVEKPRLSISVQDERETKHISAVAKGAIFYLITTDILGPFSTGYSFSRMGLGPGVALFTVFGGLAFYSGLQLWKLFLQLDSDRYPMKGYGDIAFRVYGSWFRHTVNGLQSFQFFLNVALIILSSGQSISQLTHNNLCFIVCVVVCAVAGCIVGQIRTLQRLGWLASVCVFINLFVIFSTMGVMAHSPPNYTLYAAQGLDPNFNINDPDPIRVSGSSPPGLSLYDNVNGLMNAVASFGGATLFTELLAEMRRPFDFWKGLLAADILIYICYMVYGIYCYAMQGQYVYNVSYQGISPYSWQTVCNVLELITGIIAAVLYGNIGIKVLYNNVGRELLKFPRLESSRGKWIWVFFVPIYWLLAWVVAQSVPQITTWIVILASGAIIQFTYTFPPFLTIGFKVQRDAITEGDTYDPVTRTATHVDSGLKRWIRGYKKELLWNLFDTIYYLGSCTTAVLGLIAGFKTLVNAYKASENLSAWRCESPTG